MDFNLITILLAAISVLLGILSIGLAFVALVGFKYMKNKAINEAVNAAVNKVELMLPNIIEDVLQANNLNNEFSDNTFEEDEEDNEK